MQFISHCATFPMMKRQPLPKCAVEARMIASGRDASTWGDRDIKDVSLPDRRESKPAIAALADHEVTAAIARLRPWLYDAELRALCRRLDFPTFGEALSAMVRIGVAAEKSDHHPEWSNIYGTVDILLTTHDVHGVSARDIELAHTINAMYPA